MSVSPRGAANVSWSPHARMRDLDFFSGTWTAFGMIAGSRSRAGTPLEATVSTVSVEGGFWREFRTRARPNAAIPSPLSELQLWGYDRRAGRYTAHVFDNRGNHARLSSAGWDTDTLVFEGRDGDPGARRSLRRTFVRVAPDRYSRRDEELLGGAWTTLYDAEMFRELATGLPRIYTGRATRQA